MFEKNYLQEVFRKTCLTSKSSSWNVESSSDNSPENFPPKVQFSHKILKNSTPSPFCRPFWKNNIKLNLFPGINFFQEMFIWADKHGNKFFPGDVYLGR